MSKTTLGQKFFLFAFGIVLTLVLLEGVLRLGGWFFLSLQERANLASIQKNGEYRILCLGESMTALGGEFSYPRQLEEILNSKGLGLKFTVINKGVPGTNSAKILSHLEGFLGKYHPQMVVAMIGINDSGSLMSTRHSPWAGVTEFFRQMRTYKLFRLVIAHLIHKGVDMKTQIGVSRDFSDEEDKLKDAVAQNPQNAETRAKLGRFYKNQGELRQAAEELEKALAHGPRDGYAIAIDLADCYKMLQEYAKSQDLCLKLIAQFPDRPEAYSDLGNVYFEQKRYDDAEHWYRRRIAVDPNDIWAYIKLGFCAKNKDDYREAERILSEGIRRNPRDTFIVVALVDLGYCLIHNGKYKEAEEIFKRTLVLSLNRYQKLIPEVYEGIALCYEQRGDRKSAEKIRKESQRYEEHGHVMTHENYPQIKEAVSSHKIPLVCVQYPMRDVELLEKMFTDKEGIVFVDNKSTFEKALEGGRYDDYFIDRFAVNFGHCTPRGNRLLAENIADAISKILP